ncbi:hypothetical protein J6590_033089 [Homalodisca vitripennis]|nr:hypothetical protein J6590_033089 [Homalodisca vitripennis]
MWLLPKAEPSVNIIDFAREASSLIQRTKMTIKQSKKVWYWETNCVLSHTHIVEEDIIRACHQAAGLVSVWRLVFTLSLVYGNYFSLLLLLSRSINFNAALFISHVLFMWQIKDCMVRSKTSAVLAKHRGNSDLLSCVRNCTIYQYADECQLHMSFDSELIEEAIVQINADLKRASIWTSNNGLKLNIEKCNVLHMAPKYVMQNLSESGGRAELSGMCLSLINKVKTLSALLDNNLTFSDHVTHAIQQAVGRDCDSDMGSPSVAPAMLAKDSLISVPPCIMASQRFTESI